MSDEKITVGMIGVAHFGARRRQTMRESGLFDLAACCDRNAEFLQTACEEEGAAGYDDFTAMLAHPGLEGIVISTGADSHARFAIEAMRAGLHVFVEKPLCTSVQEIRQLQDVQRETGLAVGMGHGDNATDPTCRLVNAYLESGRIGTLACYEENSSHSGGLCIQPGDWRGKAEANPGGMLFQCGVHSLHRICHLFGPVAELQAMMRYDAHAGTETADVANVLLRHESGLVGTMNCYHVTAYIHELRLFGTAGNLYIDHHRGKAWYQQRKENELEQAEPIDFPARQTGGAWSNLANWYRAAREGGEPRPGMEDGINAVLPVFAAERADETGCRVNLMQLVEEVAA